MYCKSSLILIYGVKTSLKEEVTRCNFHMLIISRQIRVIVAAVPSHVPYTRSRFIITKLPRGAVVPSY